MGLNTRPTEGFVQSGYVFIIVIEEANEAFAKGFKAALCPVSGNGRNSWGSRSKIGSTQYRLYNLTSSPRPARRLGGLGGSPAGAQRERQAVATSHGRVQPQRRETSQIQSSSCCMFRVVLRALRPLVCSLSLLFPPFRTPLRSASFLFFPTHRGPLRPKDAAAAWRLRPRAAGCRRRVLRRALCPGVGCSFSPAPSVALPPSRASLSLPLSLPSRPRRPRPSPPLSGLFGETSDATCCSSVAIPYFCLPIGARRELYADS